MPKTYVRSILSVSITVFNRDAIGDVELLLKCCGTTNSLSAQVERRLPKVPKFVFCSFVDCFTTRVRKLLLFYEL